MNLFLYDIDGTLIKTNEDGKKAFEKAFKDMYGDNINFDVNFVGGVDKSVFFNLVRINNISFDLDSWEKFKDIYVKNLAQLSKKNFNNWELLSGSMDILKYTAKMGTNYLLTGNIKSGAKIKLEVFDLMKFFKIGGYGDNYIIRNDIAKDLYNRLVKKYKDKIDNTYVIGDSVKDIKCAKEINAKSLIVLTGWESEEQIKLSKPDFIGSNLIEIRNYLKNNL